MNDLPSVSTASKDRLTAFLVVGLLASIAAIVYPVAQVVLPPHADAVTAFFGAASVAQAIVAFLLITQYRSTRFVPFAYLAISWAFATAMMLGYLVTGQGSPFTTFLVPSVATASVYWLAWHLGFPLLVLTYLFARLLTNERSERAGPAIRATAFGVTIVTVATIVLAARAGDAGWLVDGNIPKAAFYGFGYGGIALTIVALGGLGGVTRLTTIVDLWLGVSLVALLLDLTLTMIGGTRFSVGWYVARAEIVAATLVTLTVFLFEINAVYLKVTELNERLSREAFLDGLTGIPNRRYFDMQAHGAVQAAARGGLSLGLMLIDIDHFKRYNDRFGHLAGDECLRRVARTLASKVGRGYDFVARYGGEEFIVVLQDTDAAGAAVVAGRMRDAVESLEIESARGGVSPYVTVSIGVWVGVPTSAGMQGAIVKAADDALYEAKRSGRNRAVFSTEAVIVEA